MMRYFLAAIGAAIVICEAAMAQPITPPMSGITSRNDFATEAEAKRHCGGRAIVWVVASERVYYAKGDAGYARAGEGAYMCEDEARGDGNRRAGKGRR
jgi:hypothetical protein